MDGFGMLPTGWSQRIDVACARLEPLLDDRLYDDFTADVAQAAVVSLAEGDPRVLDETLAVWHRQASFEGLDDHPSPPDGTAVAEALDMLPELTGREMLGFLRPES